MHLRNVNFGKAVEALKIGKKVARKNWIYEFIYMVEANAYPATTNIAKEHFGEDKLIPYHRYIALKNKYDEVCMWYPSISDILASDWTIFDADITAVSETTASKEACRILREHFIRQDNVNVIVDGDGVGPYDDNYVINNYQLEWSMFMDGWTFSQKVDDGNK